MHSMIETLPDALPSKADPLDAMRSDVIHPPSVLYATAALVR
jgi:hypothetical protein